MVTSLDKQILPLANDLKTTFASIDSTLQQADALLIQAEKTTFPQLSSALSIHTGHAAD